MQIALLLLAAGSASRMRGGDKLLEDVGGQPCLRVLATRGLAAGARVFVTLPPDHPARRAALDGLDVTLVPVPDAARGMAHSLRAGIAALPDTVQAAMILPADMPDITADDITRLITAFATSPRSVIVRAATGDGQPGHPILFPRRLFDRFDQLEGDRGAFTILRESEEHIQLVRLPDNRAWLDLDTPEDWADWRARNL